MQAIGFISVLNYTMCMIHDMYGTYAYVYDTPDLIIWSDWAQVLRGSTYRSLLKVPSLEKGNTCCVVGSLELLLNYS